MSELTKWEQLEAPFPFSEIEVKVQTMKQDGTKALAIAYFDARAVRRRLHSVLGRGGWSTAYRTDPKGVICTLSVVIDGATYSMEDGADYTEIAAYKGGVSDSFKRAYAALCNDSLYLTDLGWQACETYTDGNGKKKFSKWTPEAWKAMEELYTKQVCPKSKKSPKEPVPAPERKGKPDPTAPYGWMMPAPLPGEWQLSTVSDKQFKFYKELLAKEGIDTNEYSPAFRSMIVRAYGLDTEIINKAGGYSFAIEFLKDALPDCVNNAIEAMKAALDKKHGNVEVTGDALAEKVKEVFAGATNGK